MNPTVTIAILAKNKEHTLPYYLNCIHRLNYPKKCINLYIRSNNNTDKTLDILSSWLKIHREEYNKVFYDDTDTQERVERFRAHEWNAERFTVLGKIRLESVKWARENNSHYFVADCDNFFSPDTLMNLINSNLPIVAPLLTDGGVYANFHPRVDDNGYYRDSPYYYHIFNREIKGLLCMPVVHCTYLIRYEYLDDMIYCDGSNRHEYVIFSDNCRKKDIQQYLDNRQLYGRITFLNTKEDLLKESWIKNYE